MVYSAEVLEIVRNRMSSLAVANPPNVALAAIPPEWVLECTRSRAVLRAVLNAALREIPVANRTDRKDTAAV